MKQLANFEHDALRAFAGPALRSNKNVSRAT
jgi:hypothetical protein